MCPPSFITAGPRRESHSAATAERNHFLQGWKQESEQVAFKIKQSFLFSVTVLEFCEESAIFHHVKEKNIDFLPFMKILPLFSDPVNGT